MIITKQYTHEVEFDITETSHKDFVIVRAENGDDKFKRLIRKDDLGIMMDCFDPHFFVLSSFQEEKRIKHERLGFECNIDYNDGGDDIEFYKESIKLAFDVAWNGHWEYVKQDYVVTRSHPRYEDLKRFSQIDTRIFMNEEEQLCLDLDEDQAIDYIVHEKDILEVLGYQG